MIEFNEACELIFENTKPLGTEERLIEKAVGFTLAQDVVSPINVAPFRNSAMDGFAVKSQWLSDCSADNPKLIPVASTSYAGDSAAHQVTDMQTMKVMTGARVPDGFDAVVPHEETDNGEKEVNFCKPANPGQHVRGQGEDITLGQMLYASGTTLTRLDIGILAAIGLRSVLTYRKPSIMIIGTGDELTDPGQALTGDCIYDANTFTILSMAEPFCSNAERICSVPDRKNELQQALCSQHDVIVTSGGVSAGERDLVVEMAESCGWKTVFHKVSIKPGKPIYFAVRGNQVMFGLPGTPLAATITCSVFLIPALKKMSGAADYRLRPRQMGLASGEGGKPKRKLIWPGFIVEENGRTVARYSSRKSTAALTALQGTDGLIFQEAVNGKTENITVEAIPWGDILNP